MKNVLITGITGMDGSYLADFLLKKGCYKIFGLHRHTATPSTKNIAHLLNRITLIPGDLTDQISLDNAVITSNPDYVYHLGAISYVAISWQQPEHVSNVNALGTLRLLNSVKAYKPDAKVFNATTSELFGKVVETPQTETTRFYPRSPYGIAKQYAFSMGVNFRESHNLFCANSIGFNHTGPRRGPQFVCQKIATAAASIKLGLQSILKLGNIEAKRDFGNAQDFVEGFWLMLEQNTPDDYVFATNKTHSIKQVLDVCFDRVGLDWEKYVEIDPAFFRPAEVDLLHGDATKAKQKLGWTESYDFQKTFEEMVDYQLKVLIT